MNSSTGPLVSVVIPTYNHAHFLGRALDSVLGQTYTNWEAIVIDNHSIDNTDEVMGRYSDPRITLLKIHNGGVIAASRNMGIRVARGEWIAFLDSDDFWRDNKLEVCVEKIYLGCDLVCHAVDILRSRPKLLARKKIRSRQLRTPVLIDLLLNGNQITNSSVVIRKRLLDMVGGIREDVEMVSCEDYNTWLRIANLTDAFVFVPEVLGTYMIHDLAISNRDTSQAEKSAIAEFTNKLDTFQRKKVDGRLSYINGYFSYVRRDYLTAIERFAICLRYASFPMNLKAAYFTLMSFLRSTAY